MSESSLLTRHFLLACQCSPREGRRVRRSPWALLTVGREICGSRCMPDRGLWELTTVADFAPYTRKFRKCQIPTHITFVVYFQIVPRSQAQPGRASSPARTFRRHVAELLGRVVCAYPHRGGDSEPRRRRAVHRGLLYVDIFHGQLGAR